MQRRTNEWYQGLREASSDEDDEVEEESSLTETHTLSPISSGHEGKTSETNVSIIDS